MKKNIFPVLRSSEERLPNEFLDDIAGKYNMEEILSSFMGLGMFPKPREFQRIILINLGKKDEADDYERRGIFINDELAERMRPAMPQARIDISPDRINYGLVDRLMGYVPRKSYFSKPICKRIILIKQAEINAYLDPPKHVKSPIPTMILAAAGYLGLAKASGKDITPLVRAVMKNRYKVLMGLVGLGVATEAIAMAEKEWSDNKEFLRKKNTSDKMEKSAKSPLSGLWLIPAITIPTYIASEHERQKAMRGHPVGAAQKALIKHPGKISIAIAALAHKGSRNMLGGIAKRIFKGAESMIGEDMGFNGLDIDAYPPSEHAKIVAGIWDALASNK